jgi:CheY-like chemotaxis protein
VTVSDGLTAWRLLQQSDSPAVAVLDWIMPGMEGPEICRRIRSIPAQEPTYLILLSAKGGQQEIVAGLQGGADDYITKPFDPEELQARLRTGSRIVQLQRSLNHQVRQLQEALARVKQLQGLLPICCYCKSIRSSPDYWEQVEAYISAHSEAGFSHGICPSCFESKFEPMLNTATDSETVAGV